MEPKDRVLIWGVLLARVLERRRDDDGRRGSKVRVADAATDVATGVERATGGWRAWLRPRRA